MEKSGSYKPPVLLHSNCSFPKFHPFLLKAVENGYLQPSEYALLKETSILWNQDSKNTWDDCTVELRIKLMLTLKTLI